MVPSQHTHQSLGLLEHEVMHLLWANGPLPLHTIASALNERRPLAALTVEAVLAQLHDKGLLTREAQPPTRYAPAYAYVAAYIALYAEMPHAA
jgi:predicted transcriptional regulator